MPLSQMEDKENIQNFHQSVAKKQCNSFSPTVANNKSLREMPIAISTPTDLQRTVIQKGSLKSKNSQDSLFRFIHLWDAKLETLSSETCFPSGGSTQWMESQFQTLAEDTHENLNVLNYLLMQSCEENFQKKEKEIEDLEIQLQQERERAFQAEAALKELDLLYTCLKSQLNE
jgi:hypothetical protein